MEQEKPVELEEAEKKIEKAREALSYLCDEMWTGRLKGAWHWEIPANPVRDTDLILGNAIGIAAQATKEVRSLRTENARLKGQAEAVGKLVEIGSQMATLIFNLAQRSGAAANYFAAPGANALQKEWDAARAALSNLKAKTP